MTEIMNTILLLSNSSEHKLQMQEICDELDLRLTVTSNVIDFILEMEKKDFQTFFIDGKPDEEYLKVLQLTKKIRPRIPIVFITDNASKEKLEQIYNEGIFYLYTTPLNKRILTEVIKSSIVFKIKKDNIFNKLIT
jgi:DNA-binding NtrC family response regulator